MLPAEEQNKSSMAFIFKRQFFIPLLIVWLGYISYFIWQLNKYYGADFSNKGLPLRLKMEWFMAQVMGPSVLFTFLLAFLVGTCCYAHYSYRKRQYSFRPFSTINLLVLMTVAAGCFVYAGFIQAGYQRKSLTMLSAIVYSRTAEDFYSGKNRTNELYLSPELNNLPQLIRLRQQAKSAETIQESNPGEYAAPWGSKVYRLDFAIGSIFLFPFIVLLYYPLGIFTGIIFRRVHIIIPVLVAGALFFMVYNLGQQRLDRLYYQEKISLRTALLSIPLVLLLLAVLGYLYCSKRYLLPGKSGAPAFQFEEEAPAP
jgi:hypothetical protein